MHLNRRIIPVLLCIGISAVHQRRAGKHLAGSVDEREDRLLIGARRDHPAVVRLVLRRRRFRQARL